MFRTYALEKSALVTVLAAELLVTAACRRVRAPEAPPATLCEINASPQATAPRYFTVDARYASDQGTFELLTDARCGLGNSVALATADAATDPSLARFYRLREEECRRRGDGLCVIEADVRAVVVCDVDSHGTLQIKLKRVLEEKFVSEVPKSAQ
jgi:hypothetical protein